MIKSNSGAIIDEVIGAGVAQWFRRAGFDRIGRSYVRRHGELFLTAHVQASKLNMPNEAVFAVNLGVEWPKWYTVWTGQHILPNPGLAPTFIQARLHPLHGVGRDYWWPADQNSDRDRTATEVVRRSQRMPMSSGIATAIWMGSSENRRVARLCQRARRGDLFTQASGASWASE